MVELDELKRLTPEERIKKLKELEEKRKQEIKKAQELLKESEEEIEEEAKKKEQTPIEQLKAMDFDALVTEEEKAIFKTKRYKQEPIRELEEKVLQEIPKFQQQQNAEREKYQKELSKQPTEQLYNKLRNLYESAHEQGQLEYNQWKEARDINYALQKKRDDIESGNYKDVPQSVAMQMVITYRMGQKMQNMYRGKDG